MSHTAKGFSVTAENQISINMNTIGECKEIRPLCSSLHACNNEGWSATL